MWTLVLLGLTALFATGSANQILVSIQPNPAPIGSDVTVQCRIAGAESGSVVTTFKKQWDRDATTVGMSTHIVADAFRNAGRFSLSKETEEGDVRFVMNIKGVKQEDSGEYGCALSTAIDDRTYGMLSVLAPVEKVNLVPIAPFETLKNELPIKEGEQYHMMCDVTGGMPAAEVTITLAGRDITDRFDREDISGWNPNSDESITDQALGFMNYNIKMNSKEAFKVKEGADDLYNREELVCKATVPSFEPVSDSLELVFMVSPSITCKGAFVPTGERNVRIQCTIRADPTPDNHNITWSWSDSFDNYSIIAGEKTLNGQVLAHELKQGLDEDEHIAELFFPRVYTSHFNTYTLHASNTVGEETVEVELQRDEAKEVGSGAFGLSSTLTLLGVTVMTAIFKCL